jgi:transposase
MGAPENAEFIPVGIIEAPATRGPAMLALPTPEPAAQPASAEGKTGSIEIALPNGARVSVDAFVDEKALSRVLRAMRGMT